MKESLKLDENITIDQIPKGLIHFKPTFPHWKKDSFDCYNIGLMDKVILRFNEKFWGNIGRITHISHEPGEYPWFDNISGDVPALLAWTACRFADKQAKKTEEEIVNDCMKILRLQFPDAPDPTFYHVTRWRNNPFTRGSYSYITTGATGERADKLPLPVGNIRFAGEAYLRSNIGCVDGKYFIECFSFPTNFYFFSAAFISGKQVAYEIIKEIHNKK